MKEPQIKAKELIENFNEVLSMWGIDEEMIINSALLCVDEILQTLDREGTLVDSDSPYVVFMDEDKITYWEQVKKHLQNELETKLS